MQLRSGRQLVQIVNAHVATAGHSRPATPDLRDLHPGVQPAQLIM